MREMAQIRKSVVLQEKKAEQRKKLTQDHPKIDEEVIDDLGLDDHKLHTDCNLDAEEDETQEVTYVLEWRRWWHKILAGEVFDRLIGLAILLNAVVVAAQVDADAKRRYLRWN